MLPSRCVRCGATSRDFLCGACLDYLVAYRPFWLNPALLPGPSLLDLIGPREVALLAADLSTVEWYAPPRDDSSADAVRLVQLLDLDAEARPVLSVGDADVLHEFLRRARRGTPDDRDARVALASVYRYLSACEWMPAHLAADYRMRAGLLASREAVRRLPVEVPEERTSLVESVGAPEPRSAESDDLVLPSEHLPEPAPPDIEPAETEETPLPAPDPFRPEPVPEPEPPLPLPEPPEPQPQPEPEPEPEPEERAAASARQSELESMERALEQERSRVDTWVRSQSEELRAKEETLAGREKELFSKQQEVEAQTRAATERLVAFEKDAARREVLRFLGTVPGVGDSEAEVISQAADVKALTQCKGVTEALARAIRYEVVPGEVEEEQRASQLREEAQSFLEEADYEAALECYDRLLRETPADMTVWFDRAELLVLMDRPEDALECYARVLEVDRRDRRAWFERANVLFGMGSLSDAVDALREALRIDGSRAPEITGKAEQLRRDGHPNEAVLLFQAVLEGDPTETRAVLGLGDSLVDLGDMEAAEALFTRALGKNPQNAPIVFRRGELLERKGRWGAAIQYYNRAIALRWNYPDPWLGKARILLEHNRASEALEAFDKATSLDSARADAWAGKARAHAILGDQDAAMAALGRAEKANSDDASVRLAREAIGTKGDVEEILPPPPSDLHSLAKAFEEIEEEPEPAEKSPRASPDIQAFIESIEPEKEETLVLLQLADLALEGGDPQMALLRYEQALEKDDRSADAWTGKGVSLQQLERYREALDAYDRALALKPDHELARRWRETCVRRLESGAGG